MIGKTILSGALVAAVLTLPAVPAAGAATSVTDGRGGQLTAADATPFLGDWVLTLEGPNGPGSFALSVNVEKEKVVGEISSETMPKQAITDVAKADKDLILRYTFTWEGNPVEAAVSLKPAADGKMAAQIDFAGGAYVMSGTAVKKEQSK
jgi:hypothetical protein